MADVEMTFLEHLEELRRRLFYCLYAIFPAIMIAFAFAEPLLEILTVHARAVPQGRSAAGFKVGFSPIIGPFLLFDPREAASILVGLSPTELVMSYMLVAIVAAIFAVFPFVMYQLWRFVEPGLKENERKFLVPFILSSWLTFILGGVFAYTVMLKIAVPFLASFGQEIAANMWSVSSYVSFTLMMMLVFGVTFELPVLSALLSMLGIVTPQFLSKYRRHAIVVIVIVAAILTPPDPVTQILLAVPLVFLYELSIVVSRFFQRPTETSLVKASEP